MADESKTTEPPWAAVKRTEDFQNAQIRAAREGDVIGQTINLIIRDVCELPYDPLPDQPHGEMRVTVDDLRAILEERLK